MNERINENGLPMNFNWRAAIGKEIGTQQNTQSNQDNGFKPYKGYNIQQGLMPKDLITNNAIGDAEFNQSLIGEIDTNINDICNEILPNIYNSNIRGIIKQRLQTYFSSIINKYKSYITRSFFELLYNTCLNAYANQWVMICANAGINDVSNTEFIHIASQIHLNPFLLYTTMAEVFKQNKNQIQEQMIVENIMN